jgi:hypothetical protein
MTVRQAKDIKGSSPQRPGESISLEVKAYRGYLAPSYLDGRIESIYYAFYVTN